MYEILEKLISMPTVSADVVANKAAVVYIGDFLKARGMSVEYKEYATHPALYASTRPGNKTPKIMIVSHVDVMAGDASLFTLRKKSGKLYGRGTFDMKFAIAATLQMVDRLKHNIADYDFGLIITSDEEYGNVEGVNSIPHLLREGYLPKVAIVLDGGDDWDLEYFVKGYWRFDMIAQGKTAHGSRPWEGDSASFKLIHAMHDIKALFKDHGPLTDTLNIGIIRGGEAINQVPAEMRASVEIRLSHEDSYERNKKAIEAICAQYGVRIKTRALREVERHDLSDPLIAAFQQSVAAIIGKQPGTCMSYGGSDASYFMQQGVACVVTRPPGGGLHGPHEWLSEKAFYQLADVLHHYIITNAKTAAANNIRKEPSTLQAA